MKSYYLALFLLVLICSCARKSADELYHAGVAAEDQKNFQTAVESYERVVRDYPTTAYAESSLIRLAPLYTNEVKDPRKAVDAYKRCYSTFPGSKQAPTMLFLAGFIFNNELHQLDSARACYEEFLAKYPSHDLAQSAKFELENLGKEPGQVLPNEVSVNTAGQPEQPAPVKKRAGK